MSDAGDSGTPGVQIVDIAAGEQHSLLLTSDGRVYATGNGSDGQLCLGEDTQFSESYVLVDGLEDVVDIEAGSNTSFFLFEDGTVQACGGNSQGNLGIADTAAVRVYEPTAVQVSNIVALRSGGGHTLALDGDADLFGFGANQSGEVGIGTSGNSVAEPTGLATLDDIDVVSFDTAIGGGFSVAVADGGTVYTWGNNLQGQLGDAGAGTSAVNPLVLGTVDGVASIAAGGGQTLALLGDGTVTAWGLNGVGELGLGTTSEVETPMAVPGLTGVVAVDAGNTFSLALDDSGAVWAWGNNATGAVGQGTEGAPSYTSPIRVAGIPTIEQIVAGSSFALARTADGAVWGWGLVDAAQLGTGISDFQYDPIQVF